MNANALRYMDASPEGKGDVRVSSLQHNGTLHRDKSGKSRRVVRARDPSQMTCLPRVMSLVVWVVIRA